MNTRAIKAAAILLSAGFMTGTAYAAGKTVTIKGSDTMVI